MRCSITYCYVKDLIFGTLVFISALKSSFVRREDNIQDITWAGFGMMISIYSVA